MNKSCMQMKGCLPALHKLQIKLQGEGLSYVQHGTDMSIEDHWAHNACGSLYSIHNVLISDRTSMASENLRIQRFLNMY